MQPDLDYYWDYPAETYIHSNNTWNTGDNIDLTVNISNISSGNEDLKYASWDNPRGNIKINEKASTNNKMFPFNHEVEKTVKMILSNVSSLNDTTTDPKNIYTIQPSMQKPRMNEFESVQNYDFSPQMLDNFMETPKGQTTTTAFSTHAAMESQSMIHDRGSRTHVSIKKQSQLPTLETFRETKIISPINTILQASVNKNNTRDQDNIFHVENFTSHHPSSLGDNFMCFTEMERWWAVAYFTFMIILFFFVPLVSSLEMFI